MREPTHRLRGPECLPGYRCHLVHSHYPSGVLILGVASKTEFPVDTGAACSALIRPAGPLSICGRPRDGRWWTAQGRVSYISPWLPRWHSHKESACKAGDPGSIPGLGRCPGEGKGYPLQYSGLENSTDCMVCGVAKSRTRLSYFHFDFFRKIPWRRK